MTNDVLVLIDGTSTEFDNIDMPAHKMKGFRHGMPKSPYRNVALGLKSLTELFPDSDWYCYLEYDCLITSERFKYNLQMADDMGIWMLGADGHVDDKKIPIVEEIMGQELKSYYLLGACQFFSKHFITALQKIDFFDSFLSSTNSFSTGEIPGYDGYDVSEHLYPSLCRHLGGGIGVLASWDRQTARWHGSYKVFPIRWQPEIEENFLESSILHPSKSFDHPLREYHRKVRDVSSFKNYGDIA